MPSRQPRHIRNASAMLLLLAAGPGTPIMSAETEPGQGGATVEVVPYKGWDRNLRLSNGETELIITLDVGPRILSYRTADGPNVLKEFDDQLGKSGEPKWAVRGGHRLWVAPEDPDRTYVPDNAPVKHEQIGPGAVRLTLPADAKHGLEKVVEVKLAPKGSEVQIDHKVVNRSSKPAELAIWSLTVMKPGGVEVIPLPAKAPHPGDAENGTVETFAPSFPLVSWSYTDFQDPRWTFGSDSLVLRQDPKLGPTKVGLRNPAGVVGYLNDGTLFIKRFPCLKGVTYPDFGSNYETFTNEEMLELETLGPLVTVAPGEATSHRETWSLVPGVKAPADPAGISRVVLPLLSK